MKFFSNLENEYNEILGETAQNEDEDSSKGPDDKEDKPDGDASFTGMLSDITKDLNTISKDEVFPAFPSGKKKEGKSDLVEESEFDVSDARKAVKSADLKRKREKRCKVGDKFYDIGERWEDEKTGKEMICILMNIPKEVQPSLAEADVTLSVDEPEEWSRPSVEPQWAYTAQPKKKTDGESTKCKSDDEEKQSEKEKPTDNKEELRKGESGGIKKEGADDKVKEPVKSKTAKKSGKEKKSGKVPTEKKGKKPNKKLPKEKVTKETSPGDEKKDGIEQSGDGSQDKRGSKPIEEEDKKVKSKLTDKKVSPESLKKETKPETSSKYVETAKVESKIRGKEGTKDSNSELERKDNKRSTVKNEENEEKGVINNLQPPGKTNDENDDLTTTTLNEQDQVKGEPIYMKETVVKRRKLLRTQETIQTTTTDKTSSSK